MSHVLKEQIVYYELTAAHEEENHQEGPDAIHPIVAQAYKSYQSGLLLDSSIHLECLHNNAGGGGGPKKHHVR